MLFEEKPLALHLGAKKIYNLSLEQKVTENQKKHFEYFEKQQLYPKKNRPFWENRFWRSSRLCSLAESLIVDQAMSAIHGLEMKRESALRLEQEKRRAARGERRSGQTPDS